METHGIFVIAYDYCTLLHCYKTLKCELLVLQGCVSLLSQSLCYISKQKTQANQKRDNRDCTYKKEVEARLGHE